MQHDWPELLAVTLVVERAIMAAWPGAQTRTETPQPPLPLTGSAAGGELRLAQPEWLPLNLDQQADPLRAVFGSVGGLREGRAPACRCWPAPWVRVGWPVPAAPLGRCALGRA